MPVIAAFQTPQTIQQISATIRATLHHAIGRKCRAATARNTTLAITYANAHGLHLCARRISTRLCPGNFQSPACPAAAYIRSAKPGAVFQVESSGLCNQNQFIAFLNSRYSREASFSASYVLNYARSDTDGIGTLSRKAYTTSPGEYGPAATDVRHRFTLNGTINTKMESQVKSFPGDPIRSAIRHHDRARSIWNDVVQCSSGNRDRS